MDVAGTAVHRDRAARLSRISSDQPSAAKRNGRNDLPGPVGIHGMPSVSRGRAGSNVMLRIAFLP